MAGTQCDLVGLSRYGIVIKAIPIDIATWAQLKDEGGGTHQRPSRAVGIQTTLKAEGRVRIDSQTACCLTDGSSVEVRRLEEDLRRCLGRTRLETTHHASDTERSALSRSDDEVTLSELPFTLIQEEHLLWACQLDRETTTRLSQVIGMEGLTELVQDVVRHVNDHVYGA